MDAFSLLVLLSKLSEYLAQLQEGISVFNVLIDIKAQC
ncbi:hypothetical protein JCM19231_2232 [Vibrio ishigakensis]|uniref:Uncharacterized protein n=1 Tax=Vibrio ishigakensis TaxID=1481914 RepID=A0A0B8NT82_9VIBR|nr:hypothetical protein JCM19231_2232 [Vibrio ishigakensis]